MRPFAPCISFLVLQSFCLAPASADQKADTLLAEIKAAYTAAKTMTVTMTIVSHTPATQQIDHTLTLQKPDKFRRIDKTIKGAPGDHKGYIFASDGKTEWYYDQTTNQYTRKPAGSSTFFAAAVLTPGMLFFRPGALVPDPADMALVHTTVTSRYIGTKKVGALVYQVLAITTSNSFGGNTMELYIGPDKLVHRAITRVKYKNKPAYGDEMIVTSMKVDAPVSEADFAFVPPAGAKEEKEAKVLKK